MNLLHAMPRPLLPGRRNSSVLGLRRNPDEDQDDWDPLSIDADDDAGQTEGLEDAEEAQPERGDFCEEPDDCDE